MINRRTLLSGTAGAAGALVGSRTLQAQMPRSISPPVSPVISEFIEFEDPAAEFRAHMRMARDLVEDEGSTITWYHWMTFMIPVGQRPVPFIRYEGIEFSYFRHLGNDNYRIHAHNLSYPRDLNTNAFTDVVVNPVTGERLEVPVTPLLNDPGTIGGPGGFRNLSGDGSAQNPYRQFRIENDLIKLDVVRSAPPDWPATHIENSCSWVEFDLFANESITSLPVHFCGHYAFEYPAWMNMPEGNGHMSGFWDGKKLNSSSELPREMLERMEREYPELLEPRWEEFDRPIPFEL